MMNPEVKEKWLAALRSRKYKKGYGALRHKNIVHSKETFCCLGVLCEIAVQEGVIPKPVLTSDGTYRYVNRTDYLPDAVKVWAGLNNVEGAFERPRRVSKYYSTRRDTLAQLNDRSDVFGPVIKAIKTYF